MHNSDESRTDLGLVRIHRNVLASIAALAAMEIEGIKRIGGNLRSGLLEFIGKKNSPAIKVEFDKRNEAKLEIPVVVKYGYNIPEVADRAQENIRTALEKMTDLVIKEININVQGIEKE